MSKQIELVLVQSLTRSFSTAAAETVVHAFIVNQLDYCNSLLYGVADRLMRRLQSVQNAAAQLVTGARRCDHITPIQWQLYWLPVRQRILFKMAVLVFLCLIGQSLSFLADDCQPVSDVRPRRLWSSYDRIHWRASFDAHTTLTVIGVLLQPGCGFGTPCRLTCNNATLLDNSIGV